MSGRDDQKRATREPHPLAHVRGDERPAARLQVSSDRVRNLFVALAAVAACASSCVAVDDAPRNYASSRSAADFDSYRLRRVGLLPFRGRDLDSERGRALQGAFAFELARGAPYEIVALDASDIAETAATDPLRLGAYDPRDVLALARRFRLDGLLVGSVTEIELYTPQALALELELVAAETGQPIWSARVALDTSEPALRATLERWHRTEDDTGAAEAQLAWLSPERLARFAARAVAETL